jgi:hypothetical protein
LFLVNPRLLGTNASDVNKFDFILGIFDPTTSTPAPGQVASALLGNEVAVPWFVNDAIAPFLPIIDYSIVRLMNLSCLARMPVLLNGSKCSNGSPVDNVYPVTVVIQPDAQPS